MGSILQEGSRIESEAFVAAGAVVRPGVVVPSGQLWVGNPARKLRDLSEKERQKLHYQSSEYFQVAISQRDVMELGGNLLDDTLQVEEGDESEQEAGEMKEEERTRVAAQ
jgi:hypothetical protein